MKILNVHKRIINQPLNTVADLLSTMSTSSDKVWPTENWPRMTFDDGIKVGAKGGHGPIKYDVEIYDPNKLIQFRFTQPRGFNGIHRFDLRNISNHQTEIKHTIDVKASLIGTFQWVFYIKWLHNALIKDGFNKLENHFSGSKKSTEWNWWVKFLRALLTKKK